jgi:hypothetical protein
MIVIDVLGPPGAAQGANTALPEDHPSDLSRVDTVTAG